MERFAQTLMRLCRITSECALDLEVTPADADHLAKEVLSVLDKQGWLFRKMKKIVIEHPEVSGPNFTVGDLEQLFQRYSVGAGGSES